MYLNAAMHTCEDATLRYTKEDNQGKWLIQGTYEAGDWSKFEGKENSDKELDCSTSSHVLLWEDPGLKSPVGTRKKLVWPDNKDASAT